MHSLGRHLKVLGASLAAMVALAAVAVSPAMAEEVNGKFSAGTIKLTTPGITLTATNSEGGEAEAKTCTISGGSPTGTTSGNGAVVLNNPMNISTKFSCTGGTTFELYTVFSAYYDTTTSSYFLKLARRESGLASPFGTYLQLLEGKGTWVNGAGAVNSTLTYNEVKIGQTTKGKILKINGTFTATTTSNGLLTLSH